MMPTVEHDNHQGKVAKAAIVLQEIYPLPLAEVTDADRRVPCFGKIL